MAYRGFVFRISRTDAAPRTFYLRLRTDHSSILFPRLWAPGRFLAAKNVVYGILFGNLGLLLALLLVAEGDAGGQQRRYRGERHGDRPGEEARR